MFGQRRSVPSTKISSNDQPKAVEKAELRAVQIELVKLQHHVIASGQKIIVVFEGRDAAGKDGVIKRITQHLSPRDVRVVALGAPSDREKSAWYFERFVAHFPVNGEIVLFNRSWYNRAGVERVMGFCSQTEYEIFFKANPLFEDLLVVCGITLVKYYLDISKSEQKRRLKQRREDPLSQWKISPIDAVAIKHWDDYSAARDTMLMRTHSPTAPWTIVRADHKPSTRINVIKDLLTRLDFPGKDRKGDLPDPDIVFTFQEAVLTNGQLAK
jgi:polyphosphate kinase